jgi:hypothetical protein
MYRAIVKRTARKNFEGVNQKEFDALLEDCAPNIHHRFGGSHALGGERHDREALRRWFQRLGAGLTLTVYRAPPSFPGSLRASLPKRDRTILRRREWALLRRQRTWNSFSSPFPGREMSGIRAFPQISALSSEKKQQLQTVWRGESRSNSKYLFEAS